MHITIHALEYNRNGVSGEGFWSVEFDLSETARGEKTRLIAVMPEIYFEEEDAHHTDATRTYVINPGDIRHNYRGDNIGAVLGPWVNANNDAAWPDLYPETKKIFPAKLVG